jgi:hypothetical protein
MADKIKILDECKDLAGKIDKKALAGAVGLMCMSWLALPIIYWLIIRKDKNGRKDASPSLDIKPPRGRGDNKSDNK